MDLEQSSNLGPVRRLGKNPPESSVQAEAADVPTLEQISTALPSKPIYPISFRDFLPGNDIKDPRYLATAGMGKSKIFKEPGKDAEIKGLLQKGAVPVKGCI